MGIKIPGQGNPKWGVMAFSEFREKRKGLDENRHSCRMESWHAYSHALGIPLGVVALVLTVVQAARYGDPVLVLGCVLYGVGMLLVYGASTSYHAVHGRTLKRVLRACDHGSIYIYIAGTYSPFALGPLSGTLGWTLFWVVWALALVGVFKTAVRPGAGGVLSTLLYLGMGWMALVVIRPLWESLPAASFGWLVAGGLVYSVGTIFYGWRRWKGGHLAWHVFVLLGSACHLVSILIFIPVVNSH